MSFLKHIFYQALTFKFDINHKMGPCKVRNETETKRNETKRNKSKRNETDRNETKQIETKRNKSKRNETNCMERQIDIYSIN